ncbi:hypothetical protein OC844_006947, partial [Tilletia horrida]
HQHRLYISGYDGTIRTLKYDLGTHTAEQIDILNISNAAPSWLAFQSHHHHHHHGPRMVYATDESSPGHIYAINIQHHTGALSLKQTAKTGDGPVAIAFAGSHPHHHHHHDDHHRPPHPPSHPSCLFAADYSAGTVTVHSLKKDGSFADLHPAKTFSFHGSGPVSSRQDKSYPHQVVTDPAGRFVYVPDLGADKIHVLAVPHGHKTKCSEVKLAFSIDAPAGSGPRHLSFFVSPAGTYAYLTSELSNSLTAFQQDPHSGKLRQIGEPLLVLPPGTTYAGYTDGGPNASEVGLTADGHFVLAGARGSPDQIDHIAVFRRSEHDGSITWSDWFPTEGQTVRHFSITKDPASSLVAAANQDSGSVIIYSRNPVSGALTKQVLLNDLGKPAFAQFVRA